MELKLLVSFAAHRPLDGIGKHRSTAELKTHHELFLETFAVHGEARPDGKG